MTADSDFKKLVRARMAETGETYTSARAAMIADREQAERFRAKTLRSFFRDGRLASIPVKRRARVIVLLELLGAFEPGTDYPEKQVNEILSRVHEDVAYLRRELVDYGFLRRANGIYRLADEVPERGHTVTGEVPPDEARLFARATGQNNQ
ncbi:DUF2087 domain-containing protein [Nigerium massiliense]|uniref:DUF2087 domain-containing protein n=1 Tax=Nigerium massiliense TaxID=1522317 RepID=UPI00058E3308|nr:DUF2087 domain-containing protein [Nigerium massiliense]